MLAFSAIKNWGVNSHFTALALGFTYKLTCMTIYFKRLRPYPVVEEIPPDLPGCWRVFTICESIESSDARPCTTLADARAMEKLDLDNARSSWRSFLKKAHTGQNFSDLYDKKQCHEAHSFKSGSHDVKIWRVWGAGKIRIYFVYLPDKRIVVLKTWAKRENKLTSGETKLLEGIATKVLSCVEMYTFESREI